MATFGSQNPLGSAIESGEIIDGSITNAKVNDAAAIAASKLLGNDTAYDATWNGNTQPVSQNAVYDKFESLTGIKTATANLSAVDLAAMFAAPVVVVAGVADQIHVLVAVSFNFTVGGTQYTGGGNVRLQEETSATALTGTIATNTLVNGAASFLSTCSSQATAVSSMTLGKGITISNQTAAFITGTGTAVVKVTYYTITP